MNILFIGPYRQTDGWGTAAKEYALALMQTGHDVTLRPVYMSNTHTSSIPQEFIDHEHKRRKTYDVVIQKVLPQLLEFPVNRDSKYVHICEFETSNLQRTGWPRYINFMHELWVSSQHEIASLKNSGVDIPIQNVLEPIDIEKFDKSYDQSMWERLGWHDNFMFYFIGEYIPRKNLPALLLAFHREFGPNEPVDLVIKTNRLGMHQNDLTNLIDNDITQLKETLKIYNTVQRYRPEWVVTEHLPEDHLYSLHQICDCFVMPSYGEACCRPLMDAVGFGNQVIVTNNTGMTNYVPQDCCGIVPSVHTPVVSTEHPLPYLYTGHETWSSINIEILQSVMRQAYELGSLQKAQLKQKYKNFMRQFSYTNIAKRINEVL